MAKEVFKFVPRDRVRERPRLMKVFTEPSMTQQQFKDECDINILMRKYQSTGTIPQSMVKPIYGDFTKVPDYQAAMNVVIEADGLFASLPSEVRKRFDNDPAKFLAFADDPANGDELIALGLREKPKPAAPPVEVRVVDSPADSLGDQK